MKSHDHNMMNGMKSSLEVVEFAPSGSPDKSAPTLLEYMNTLPPGVIQYPSPVLRSLVDVWDELEGSDDGGMRWDKLLGARCEDLSWDPPYLTFKIERHGGTVNGSSRAELQYWCVNLSSRNAHIVKRGHRQLYRMSKRLDVGKLAEETVGDIVNRRESAKLKWYPDGRVKVIPKEIIPNTNAQTTANRRKRFRFELDTLLNGRGWIEVSLYTYKKSEGN